MDINSLLSDVVKLVGKQKELNNLSIEFNYSSEPIIIYGDLKQLKQVFLNMILNTIDATEDGGQIRISTCRLNELDILLKKAYERRLLSKENVSLKRLATSREQNKTMISRSNKMNIIGLVISANLRI
ncbi:MAG: hypothetical protein ACUZ8N_02525 [Candidatus Scalindua sp.]